MKRRAQADMSRRRALLGGGAAAVGAGLMIPDVAVSREIGAGRSGYGERSKYETAQRTFRSSVTPGTGASRTPLQDLYGIITPSALHYERHHSGIPNLDPSTHELLLHGLVARPLRFTMDELHQFPSVSRIHFIECAGNAAQEHRGNPAPTVQSSHGLLSCSEWSGVLLSTLLQEAGLNESAKWIVAEGADAARHTRSIPIAKALDDVIVAYGQNGEAIRPEQGYPLRLVVPGWEGNINVKWLRRLQITDQPAMSRDESSSYTDLLPDGRARRFTFEMQTNSVITRPSGGQRIAERGFHEITGLAWSGYGKIARVEISDDGGQSWRDAELQTPVLPKALTRFRAPWRWMGEELVLQSRATDESGYIQPTREVLVAARGMKAGPDGFNHYHGIKAWKVHRDGSVSHI